VRISRGIFSRANSRARSCEKFAMIRASLPGLRSDRSPGGDVQRVFLTRKPFEIDYVPYCLSSICSPCRLFKLTTSLRSCRRHSSR
jgi:hypothetical protein